MFLFLIPYFIAIFWSILFCCYSLIMCIVGIWVKEWLFIISNFYHYIVDLLIILSAIFTQSIIQHLISLINSILLLPNLFLTLFIILWYWCYTCFTWIISRKWLIYSKWRLIIYLYTIYFKITIVVMFYIWHYFYRMYIFFVLIWYLILLYRLFFYFVIFIYFIIKILTIILLYWYFIS